MDRSKIWIAEDFDAWSVGPRENIGRAGLEILNSGIERPVSFCGEGLGNCGQGKAGKVKIAVSPRFLYDLPPHHNDPFDRLLIAQALVEQMVVLTSDHAFRKYPVELVGCGR
jgi:hypothetical protein